jgi:hypothetical protein
MMEWTFVYECARNPSSWMQRKADGIAETACLRARRMQVYSFEEELYLGLRSRRSKLID